MSDAASADHPGSADSPTVALLRPRSTATPKARRS